MLIIDNTLVSDEILELKFCCNIDKCKGMCCVDGDEGAPLTTEDIEMIQDNIEEIKPYMTFEGISILDAAGVFVNSPSDNPVTPLMIKGECIFCHIKDDKYYCAIEMAYNDKKIHFKKPSSCELYPIRITEMHEYESLNYHCWGICESGLECGEDKNILLYEFLKEPLIKQYGEDWYDQLLEIKKHYRPYNPNVSGEEDLD